MESEQKEFSKEVWKETQHDNMLALESATSNIIKEEMQIKISYIEIETAHD